MARYQEKRLGAQDRSSLFLVILFGRTVITLKIPPATRGPRASSKYCAQNALDEMVNVCSKKCKAEDCGKQPSFGVVGTKTADYCA